MKIDIAKPDSHVGQMLDSEAVERLRAAIDRTRAQRRLGLKEIASATGVPEHTVRNFAYRRSNRPSNVVLGKLYKYFAERSELLPTSSLEQKEAVSAPSDEPNPMTASKPSIAVLPFANMSGDPEQRYFSDGITEDIITELSRFRSLAVIARNSSFQYRDRPADVRHIGQDLGVDYVVEGSVRKAGNRIRITAQLVEAATGNHLWAEHYDRDLEDIFAVQDTVAQTIVAILPGRIDEAGARSARRKRPESLAAYDYLLRGLELLRRFERAQTQAVRELFEKAIALDPTLARAYPWLALTEMRQWWNARSHEALEKAYMLAKRAVALDENDGFCNAVLGYVLLERRQIEKATFHLERAIALNPNDSIIVVILAQVLAYMGQPDEALARTGEAFRLNPLAPQAYHSTHGMVLYAAHRDAEAVAAFGRITTELEVLEYVYLVASYGQLGRPKEAEVQVSRCKALHHGASLLKNAAQEPYTRPQDLDHLLDGLRKAGLND